MTLTHDSRKKSHFAEVAVSRAAETTSTIEKVGRLDGSNGTHFIRMTMELQIAIMLRGTLG
jgi:hypothetical protein